MFCFLKMFVFIKHVIRWTREAVTDTEIMWLFSQLITFVLPNSKTSYLSITGFPFCLIRDQWFYFLKDHS